MEISRETLRDSVDMVFFRISTRQLALGIQWLMRDVSFLVYEGIGKYRKCEFKRTIHRLSTTHYESNFPFGLQQWLEVLTFQIGKIIHFCIFLELIFTNMFCDESTILLQAVVRTIF